MDAVWYGIADFSQFIFKLIRPIGMSIDMIFFSLGLIGTVYWLWYTVHVKKGGKNYMSHPREIK